MEKEKQKTAAEKLKTANELYGAATKEFIASQNKLVLAERELRRLAYEAQERTSEVRKTELKEMLRKRYLCSNGLTIERLRRAGNKVRVHHIRYSTLATTGDALISVPIPSEMRRFQPVDTHGGATYIYIKSAEGKEMLLTSICHQHDQFDRKLGIKKCLDSVSPEIAAELLAPLELVEAAQS